MQGPSFWGLVLGAGLALGCGGPSLDVPSAPQPGPKLEVEPAQDDGTVPLVFRGRLRQAPAGEPWLFRDELSDYYERALKRGEVPTALNERAVPLRFWRDGDDCLLQPLAWLEPEQDYALAFTGLGVLQLLHATGGQAQTTRIFPSAASRKSAVAVVCGADPQAMPAELALDPGSVPLRVEAAGSGALADCVRLTLDAVLTQPAVAAPVLGGALLEPSPWVPRNETAEMPFVCQQGQPFHGACLEASDDRFFITPEVGDQLWSVTQPLSAVLSLPAGVRSVVARGLTPDHQISFSGQLLSSNGAFESFDTSIKTRSAQRHLILNEVLANPLGPEPAGEWIELLNDGAEPASLAGLWLEDAGGHVALPSVVVGSGELALLVGADFRVSALDVAVPKAVQLVRVSSLGARGLSNSGEPLLLVGPEGVLSRFPLLAAPHAGRSIARREPDTSDDDPAGFAEHGTPPGASPGAVNSFD